MKSNHTTPGLHLWPVSASPLSTLFRHSNLPIYKRRPSCVGPNLTVKLRASLQISIVTGSICSSENFQPRTGSSYTGTVSSLKVRLRGKYDLCHMCLGRIWTSERQPKFHPWHACICLGIIRVQDAGCESAVLKMPASCAACCSPDEPGQADTAFLTARRTLKFVTDNPICLA